MKRVLSMILSLILMISPCISVNATEKSGDNSEQNLLERMEYYLNTENDELLSRNNNYGYMQFISDFKNNDAAVIMLDIIDKLIKTGSKPDKQKYMEVLVNIIATYEMDNAEAISEQYKNDNLKSALDYAIDVAEISADAVSLMVEFDDASEKLEGWISSAISGISILAENTNDWAKTISNLETIVQNYTYYDNFLELIENNSDGDLKDAASTLRTSLSNAMKIKLETYNQMLDENFQDYTEFFFDDLFFKALKQTDEYTSDEDLQNVVFFGENIVSAFANLKTAWSLGTSIGTLVGDVVVGGEDLINRVLEMMALYDISVVLQKRLYNMQSVFEASSTTKGSVAIAEEYIAYSNFLIGCRIRGEYCLYSVVASDAGLLSWFGKQNAEEAKTWYEIKANRIMDIREELLITLGTLTAPVETTFKVVDKENGKSVADVTCLIVASGNRNQTISVKTDNDGFVSVKLDAGEYSIVLNHDDYDEYQTEISIEEVRKMDLGKFTLDNSEETQLLKELTDGYWDVLTGAQDYIALKFNDDGTVQYTFYTDEFYGGEPSWKDSEISGEYLEEYGTYTVDGNVVTINQGGEWEISLEYIDAQKALNSQAAEKVTDSLSKTINSSYYSGKVLFETNFDPYESLGTFYRYELENPYCMVHHGALKEAYDDAKAKGIVEDVIDSSTYIKVLKEIMSEYRYEEDYNDYNEYYLYDLNQDNINELIILIGNCEAAYKYMFFDVTGVGYSKIGETNAFHSCLRYSNEGKLYRTLAHMGYMEAYEISETNQQIEEVKIYEGEYETSEECVYPEEIEAATILDGVYIETALR